jgi:hypothetical protein
MKQRTWFSCSARFAVQIEGQGVVDEMRSVILLRARDFADGAEKALQAFLSMETGYQNGSGETVRWRLVMLDTLDLLGDSIPDGREIYAERLAPSSEVLELAAGNGFSPATHKPTQSGV